MSGKVKQTLERLAVEVSNVIVETNRNRQELLVIC